MKVHGLILYLGHLKCTSALYRSLRCIAIRFARIKRLVEGQFFYKDNARRPILLCIDIHVQTSLQNLNNRFLNVAL